ncbi:MAG TPA: MATE family efflux transporter, partial [Daejeonella sp.]
MIKRTFSKYQPHYQTNLKLAVPVVISQLGHTLVHTADSIIVGHFAGTVPLAAVALVNSIFMVIMVIGMGISYGLTPLIAQESGRKNFKECGKLLANSLLINSIIGIILYVLVYYGSLAVIDNMDQSPEVVRQAKPYLALLGISIIPLMVFMTFKQFAEGLGFTKQAMMISLWGNV